MPAAQPERRGWPGHQRVHARLRRAMLGHDGRETLSQFSSALGAGRWDSGLGRSGLLQRSVLGDLGPLGDLVLEEGVELRRRAADVAIAERYRLLLDVGQRQDALHVGVNL